MVKLMMFHCERDYNMPLSWRELWQHIYNARILNRKYLGSEVHTNGSNPKPSDLFFSTNLTRRSISRKKWGMNWGRFTKHIFLWSYNRGRIEELLSGHMLSWGATILSWELWLLAKMRILRLLSKEGNLINCRRDTLLMDVKHMIEIE
jgi:hypothetical protein